MADNEEDLFVRRYIEKIIIKNFKLFEDVEIEMDQNINLIKGANGSGKTSFLKSIIFALTDEIKFDEELFNQLVYNRYHKEISVSILFSNKFSFTRKLFPLTESFFINDKRTAKIFYYTAIKYFIRDSKILIPQGEINQLISTNVRLNNEAISLATKRNILDELKQLEKKISEKIQSIDSLRSTLLDELESNEDREYVKENKAILNKKKKILQLAIRAKQIDSLKQRIQDKKNKYQLIRRELNSLAEIKEKLDIELANLKEKVQDECVKNFSTLDDDAFNEMITKKIQFKLEFEKLEEQLKIKLNERSRIEQQLFLITDEIQQKKDELSVLEPKLDELIEKEKSISKDLNIAKLRIDLIDKRSDESRDQEIQRINEKKQECDELKKHLNEIETRKNEAISLTQKLSEDKQEIDNSIQETVRKISELKHENLKYCKLKRELSAEIDQLKIKLSYEVEKKKSFYSLIGESVLKGKENIDKIIEMFKNGTDEEKQLVKKYYGWFIDNIFYDDALAIPIERTSFQYFKRHVVQDSNTASRLIQKFNELKSEGIVEFAVLDLLSIEKTAPEMETDIYKMMTNKIKCTDAIQKAFKHCYRKIYICRTIEQVMKLKKNVTFVSMDGDILSNKRTLNGGYIDKNKLWSNHYSNYKKCKSSVDELSNKLKELEQNLQNYENKVEQNNIKLEQYEDFKAKKNFEQFETQTKLKKTSMEMTESDELFKKYSDILKRKLNEIEYLEDKLKLISDRTQHTEIERIEQICDANQDVIYWTKQLRSVNKELNQLKLTADKIELDLKENLLKREVDLSEELKLCDFEISKLETKKANTQSLIKTINNSTNQDEEEYESLNEEEKEKLNSRLERDIDLVEKKKELCRLEAEIKKNMDKQKELKFALDKYMELQRIRENEMSSIKSEVNQNKEKVRIYMNHTVEELTIQLNNCENELEELGSEYTPYFENEAILNDFNQIISSYRLDLNFQKIIGEIIKKEVTYDQSKQFLSLFVNRFSEIFKWFRPNGKIDYRVRNPDENFPEGEFSDDFRICDSRVTVQVSFNGEMLRSIEYSSGGQKSILSLCFILAIQELRPQPTLMIDEADQNLDESTCVQLALFLKERFTNKVQFFFTSNRTFFTNYASRVFEVLFRDYFSTITQVESDSVTNQESNNVETSESQSADVTFPEDDNVETDEFERPSSAIQEGDNVEIPQVERPSAGIQEGDNVEIPQVERPSAAIQEGDNEEKDEVQKAVAAILEDERAT